VNIFCTAKAQIVGRRKYLEKEYNDKMPKQINYTLPPDEVRNVQRAMKSRNSRVAERATIIHALHCGKKPPEVAELQNVSKSKVYETWYRYQAGGIEGLKNRPVSGRPTKVTAEYRAILERVINLPPVVQGYEFTVWTAERLRLHMKEATGIEVCETTLLNVLKDMGYVYRRPKKDLTNWQDADERERFQERLVALKKGRGTAIAGFSLWTKAASNSTSPSTPVG